MIYLTVTQNHVEFYLLTKQDNWVCCGFHRKKKESTGADVVGKGFLEGAKLSKDEDQRRAGAAVKGVRERSGVASRQ